MLKFRMNARNRILSDFLSQLRDCDDSPNRVMICAGAYNYRLVLDPTKTLTTLRQIAGHNNRDSPRVGSPLRPGNPAAFGNISTRSMSFNVFLPESIGRW